MLFAIFLSFFFWKFSKILRRQGGSPHGPPTRPTTESVPPEPKSWRRRWIQYIILYLDLLIVGN